MLLVNFREILFVDIEIPLVYVLFIRFIKVPAICYVIHVCSRRIAVRNRASYTMRQYICCSETSIQCSAKSSWGSRNWQKLVEYEPERLVPTRFDPLEYHLDKSAPLLIIIWLTSPGIFDSTSTSTSITACH